MRADGGGFFQRWFPPMGPWLGRMRVGRLAKSSASVMFWSAARLAAQLIWVLLLARRLGASSYGTFSGVASLALAMSGFVGLGLGLRMYQDSARDLSLFSLRWHQALMAFAGSGVVLALLFLVCAPGMFQTTNWMLLLAISLSELMLAPIVNLVAYGYASHGWMGHAAAAPVLLSIARIVAVLALYFLPSDAGIDAYGWLHAAATGCGATALLWSCGRQLDISSASERLRWSDVRAGLGFSAVQASGLALSTLDKSFALRWGGDVMAGRYVAAYRFVSVAALPVDSLMMAAMPHLFRAGVGRRDASISLLGALGVATVGYGVVVGLAVWWSADLVPWLLGASFAGAQAAVRMLAAYVPLYCLRTLGTNVLLGFGWKRWRFVCELLAMVCMLVVAAWRIPISGLSGAVVALLAAEVVLVVLVWGRVLFSLAYAGGK